MLSALDPPGNVVEEGGVAALDAKAGYSEQRRLAAGGGGGRHF